MSMETTRTVMTNYLKALELRAPVAAFFTPDVKFVTMGGQTIQGREEVAEFIRWLHQDAFDARPEFKATLIAGDQATLEADFVGRHTAEFFGVPASQHNVRVPYAVVYDLRDGLIAELRFYMPMNVLMEQITTSGVPALAAA
jgi:limonene-1,2-epoxide hydrolase